MLMPIVFSILAITAAATLLEKSPSKESVSDRDRRLIERIKSGDRRALEELYKHYEQTMTKLVWHRMVGRASEEDVEDMVMDVSAVFFRKIAGFRSESAVLTWLYRVVDLSFIGYWNKQSLKNKREVHLHTTEENDDQKEIDFEDPGPLLIDLAITSELELWYRKAINNLEQPRRNIYILSEIEDCDYQTIAVATGLPLGTVKSNIGRAKKQIINYFTTGDGKEFYSDFMSQSSPSPPQF